MNKLKVFFGSFWQWLRAEQGLAQIPIILGLAILVAGLAAAGRLTQQEQDIREYAAVDVPCNICSAGKCLVNKRVPPSCSRSLDECLKDIDCSRSQPKPTVKPTAKPTSKLVATSKPEPTDAGGAGLRRCEWTVCTQSGDCVEKRGERTVCPTDECTLGKKCRPDATATPKQDLSGGCKTGTCVDEPCFKNGLSIGEGSCDGYCCLSAKPTTKPVVTSKQDLSGGCKTGTCVDEPCFKNGLDNGQKDTSGSCTGYCCMTKTATVVPTKAGATVVPTVSYELAECMSGEGRPGVLCEFDDCYGHMQKGDKDGKYCCQSCKRAGGTVPTFTPVPTKVSSVPVCGGLGETCCFSSTNACDSSSLVCVKSGYCAEKIAGIEECNYSVCSSDGKWVMGSCRNDPNLGYLRERSKECATGEVCQAGKCVVAPVNYIKQGDCEIPGGYVRENNLYEGKCCCGGGLIPRKPMVNDGINSCEGTCAADKSNKGKLGGPCDDGGCEGSLSCEDIGDGRGKRCYRVAGDGCELPSGGYIAGSQSSPDGRCCCDGRLIPGPFPGSNCSNRCEFERGNIAKSKCAVNGEVNAACDLPCCDSQASCLNRNFLFGGDSCVRVDEVKSCGGTLGGGLGGECRSQCREGETSVGPKNCTGSVCCIKVSREPLPSPKPDFSECSIPCYSTSQCDSLCGVGNYSRDYNLSASLSSRYCCNDKKSPVESTPTPTPTSAQKPSVCEKMGFVCGTEKLCGLVCKDGWGVGSGLFSGLKMCCGVQTKLSPVPVDSSCYCTDCMTNYPKVQCVWASGPIGAKNQRCPLYASESACSTGTVVVPTKKAAALNCYCQFDCAVGSGCVWGSSLPGFGWKSCQSDSCDGIRVPTEAVLPVLTDPCAAAHKGGRCYGGKSCSSDKIMDPSLSSACLQYSKVKYPGGVDGVCCYPPSESGDSGVGTGEVECTTKDVTGANNPACCCGKSDCPESQECNIPNGYCQSGSSCNPNPDGKIKQKCAYDASQGKNICAWQPVKVGESDKSECTTNAQCAAIKDPIPTLPGGWEEPSDDGGGTGGDGGDDTGGGGGGGGNSEPEPTVPPGIKCLECPLDFACYVPGEGASAAGRWFAPGYQWAGWVKAEAAESCSGVTKPVFKGKGKGDANCSGSINMADFSIWRSEFVDLQGNTLNGFWEANFNCPTDWKVNLVDFSIWRLNFEN